MKNLVGACMFGQSGGPTSVINSSAAGVFTEALKQGNITAVYGAQAQDSRILIQEKATGLYGYASLEGNVVIPPRYAQAQDFCGGYARVTQGEKTFFIDPQGNPASQAP